MKLNEDEKQVVLDLINEFLLSVKFETDDDLEPYLIDLKFDAATLKKRITKKRKVSK